MATATDEEYLERAGVTAYLKDVTTLLLENRPADPIHFIAEYFHNVVRGSNPYMRAYRYITLTTPDKPNFQENAAAAYMSLDGRSGAPGVSGRDLATVLGMLCDGLPDESASIVMTAVARGETEPVDLAAFVCAVRVCITFKQLLASCREALGRGGGAEERAVTLFRQLSAIARSATPDLPMSSHSAPALEDVERALKQTTDPAALFRILAQYLARSITAASAVRREPK